MLEPGVQFLDPVVKLPPVVITAFCTLVGVIAGFLAGNTMMWGVFGLFTGFILDIALRRPHW